MNYLKPSNEKIKPKKLYGFDVETYGDDNKFLMGSIVNETEQYIFWDLKKLQNFIFNSRKLKGCRLFATNIGFDFLVTFGTKHNKKDIKMLSRFTFLIRGSEFINIKYSHNNHLVNFSDTMTFFKCGVKGLGKIIGYPKLKKPKCLGKYVKQDSKEGKELQTYNIRDSYISFKFADFLQKSFNNLGVNMKYTIASTSMSLFRNKYLKTWIMQPNKEILKKTFLSYYGGRTEAFFRGDISNKNLKMFDINSLYPFCLNNFEYPNPNTIKTTKKPTLKLINKYEGISLCSVGALNIKYSQYPLLPFRHDFKLKFPIGVFSGWYCHNEIRKAIQLNYNIKPLETIYYTETFNPFSNFVTDLYNKRMEYKKIKSLLELIYKIVLNSLYGKFAQKLEKSEILFYNLEKDKKKVWEQIYHNYNNDTDRYKLDFPMATEKKISETEKILEPTIIYSKDTETKEYPKFINPILSSYTTAYARIVLYEYFENIIKKRGKIYYCDTDSIITDIDLKTGNKLGQMKNECNIKKGIIIKPKLYYVTDNKDVKKVKAKGMSNLKEILQFKKLIKTKKYKYMKFTKFKESLRRDIGFNQKIDVLKTIDINDNKRDWKNKEFNLKEIQESKAYNITDFSLNFERKKEKGILKNLY